MSSSPFLVNGNDVRWGVALGKGINQVDSLWSVNLEINISSVFLGGNNSQIGIFH